MHLPTNPSRPTPTRGRLRASGVITASLPQAPPLTVPCRRAAVPYASPPTSPHSLALRARSKACRDAAPPATSNRTGIPFIPLAMYRGTASSLASDWIAAHGSASPTGHLAPRPLHVQPIIENVKDLHNLGFTFPDIKVYIELASNALGCAESGLTTLAADAAIGAHTRRGD